MTAYSGSAPHGDESDADPAEMAAMARRWEVPENELPAAAGVSAVLARTDEVAIGLVGVDVYTAGLRLRVAVRRRTHPADDEDEIFHLAMGHRRAQRGRRLLVGVQFADGRVAAAGGDAWESRARPDQPLLTSRGGGGGGRTFDTEYWLTPLPPPGDLVVVCAWPAFDIPETETVLDGDVLRAAADLAVVLWPDEPQPRIDRRPETQPAEDLPAGGWFRRAFSRDDA